MNPKGIHSIRYHKWYRKYPNLLLAGNGTGNKSSLWNGLYHSGDRRRKSFYICDGKNDELYEL